MTTPDKPTMPWWQFPISEWLPWRYKEIVKRLNWLGASHAATHAEVKALREAFDNFTKNLPPSIKMHSDQPKDK